MPKIEKKKVNLPIAVKTAKKTRPKKKTSDPVSYYNCLLTYANQN
jgi:hypothetical protein